MQEQHVRANTGTRKGLAFFLHISGTSMFNSSGVSLRSASNILHNLTQCIFTWKLEVSPFLRGATEAVPVLLEVAAAGHEQLITALLCVTLRVKLDGEVDSTRNVNFILRNKHSSFVSCHTAQNPLHAHHTNKGDIRKILQHLCE